MYSDSPSKIENDPEIKRLAYATRVANFTQEKYRKYKRDMRNERDIRYKCEINFNNGLLKGREEGMTKGIEVGRDEERVVIARNCKAMGMDAASIAKVTGLSEEAIAEL